MIRHFRSRYVVHAAAVTVLAGLMLALTGCRTVPLAGGGTLARSGVSSAERTVWVPTKATYDRVGLSRDSFAPTAAPAAADTSGGAASGEALAKESQNPIASLISVPFQNNTSFGSGPYDRTHNTLNIQPVFPVSLGRKWSLVNRAIFPIIHQPDTMSSSGGWDGLGDINLTSFVVAPPQGDWMFGAGPAILIPSATDVHVGQRAWGIGPSAIVVYTHGNWVAGGLVNNIWGLEKGDSPAGNGTVEERNLFYTQIFVNYNLPNMWYLVTGPIITADWNAPSDDRWVVPVGGGFGKVFKIGNQNFNASLQAYYNIEKPDGGPDWMLRVQLVLLFPKS